MSRVYSKYVPLIFLVSDIVSLNVSAILANQFYYGTVFISFRENLLYISGSNLLWIIVFFSSRLHKIKREFRSLDYLNQVLTGLVINLSIIFALWFAFEFEYSRKYLFYNYLFFSILIVSWRIVWYLSISFIRSKGYNFKSIVVAGYNETTIRLVSHFKNNPGYGYRILGFFDSSTSPRDEIIGTLEEIEDFSKEKKIDIIFCFLPLFDRDDISRLISFAESNLIKVKILSQFSYIDNKNLSIQKYGDISVLNLSAIPLDSRINRIIKRVFDIIFSSLVIVFVFTWLVPILAIFIKLESKGPIFFKQDRTGKDNMPFKCLKFRTMVVNELADIQQATKNDPRITKIGSVLRKTSIDELPQFFNVFKGDMSVVGPRPHRMRLNSEFSHKIEKFNQRHAVKPGITGLAQAKGFRGETAELSDMSGRVKLDRFYVKNWSLILDFKIILLTAISIIKGDKKAY